MSKYGAAIQMSYGLGYANPHSSQIDAVYPRNLVLSAPMCTFAASNLIRQIKKFRH